MTKKMLRIGLASLFAVQVFFNGGMTTSLMTSAFAQGNNKETTQVSKIKGKITNISQRAKTIALSNKKTNFFLVKFNEQTKLKGAKSSKDFKPGEAVLVEYKTQGEEHLAVSIEKAMAKVPKGASVIKTDELAKLLEQGENLVVIDARPPAKYAEAHIPSSISIPYSKLAKMGDKGAELLDKYKNKQLVFYCGGPT
ncbi:MAG: hypothetical protein CSB32_01235 [Desulfobacterales bacterium]|nr:MAG: hypothetical protein CSB32_01235 [Desulfobacterales bacterium]